MKLPTALLALPFTLIVFAVVCSAQQITCSCEKSSQRTCGDTVRCDKGCSAVCGYKDTCLLSCASDYVGLRITVKLVRKRAGEIASVLTRQTQKHIEFTPYPRNSRTLYDLEIKDDDIWNVLKFLDKFGNVKFNGVDFPTLRKLQRESRTGKNVSLGVMYLPTGVVIEMLQALNETYSRENPETENRAPNPRRLSGTPPIGNPKSGTKNNRKKTWIRTRKQTPGEAKSRQLKVVIGRRKMKRS